MVYFIFMKVMIRVNKHIFNMNYVKKTVCSQRALVADVQSFSYFISCQYVSSIITTKTLFI